MHDLTFCTTGELRGMLSDTLREAAIARALVVKLEQRAGRCRAELDRRRRAATIGITDINISRDT